MQTVNVNSQAAKEQKVISFWFLTYKIKNKYLQIEIENKYLQII